jgi:hypothetical protein
VPKTAIPKTGHKAMVNGALPVPQRPSILRGLVSQNDVAVAMKISISIAGP